MIRYRTRASRQNGAREIQADSSDSRDTRSDFERRLRVAALGCLGLMAAGMVLAPQAADAQATRASEGAPPGLPLPGAVTRPPPNVMAPPTPPRVVEQAARWRAGERVSATAGLPGVAGPPANLPMPGRTYYAPPEIVRPAPMGPKRLRREPAPRSVATAAPPMPGNLPQPGSVAYAAPGAGQREVRPTAPAAANAAPVQQAQPPRAPAASRPPSVKVAPSAPVESSPLPPRPSAVASLPPPRSTPEVARRQRLALPPGIAGPSTATAPIQRPELAPPASTRSENVASRLPVLPPMIPPPLRSSLPGDAEPAGEGPIVHPNLGPSALSSPIGVEGVMKAKPVKPEPPARTASEAPPAPSAEAESGPQEPEAAMAESTESAETTEAMSARGPNEAETPGSAETEPAPSAAIASRARPSTADEESDSEIPLPPSVAESGAPTGGEGMPPPSDAAPEPGAPLDFAGAEPPDWSGASSSILGLEDLPPPPPDLPLPSSATTGDDHRKLPGALSPAEEPEQRVAALEPPKQTKRAPIGEPTPGAARLEVAFPVDSAKLNDQARATIKRAAEAYRTRGKRLRIVGHASSQGAERRPGDHTLANFEMSLKRATAVSNELIRLGVEPGAIVVEAVGDRASAQRTSSNQLAGRSADIYLE